MDTTADAAATTDYAALDRIEAAIHLLVEQGKQPREKKVRDPDEVHGHNHRRSVKFSNLAKAIAQAQAKFTTVKRKNEASIESRRTGDQYGYKYADLGDFIDMARMPLAEAGIAVIQFPTFESDGQHGWVTVETVVAHESGEWMANTFEMGTSSLRPQDIGIATTYCRRYAYTAIFNMISEREDDDGNKASGNKARFRRDGGDEWDNSDGWQPPGPPDDGQHPNAPREPAAKRKEPAAQPRPPATKAPAKGAEPKPEEPARQPAIAKTPEAVRDQVRELAPKPDAKRPAKPEPDGRGPNDLVNAIKSFQVDLPDSVGEAIETLQNGYEAQIDYSPEGEISIQLGRGSYTAAHDELTKLYKTLRRATRAGGK